MLLLFSLENEPRETLRYIEEKMGIGLFSLNVRTGERAWSNGIYMILGLPAGSVKPDMSVIHQMTHPDDRNGASTEETIKLGIPIAREFRLIRKNGRVRWLSSRTEVLMGADGQPERLVGIVSDITGLRDAEGRAEVSERRRKALGDVAGGTLWSASPDGGITEISNSQSAQKEYVSQLFGRGWIEWVHPDDRATTESAWETAIEQKSPVDLEHRVRQTDGSYRWKRSRAVPLLAGSGEILEWAGFTLDVHDLTPIDGPDEIGNLTGAQIRAARGILNWSVRDLAEKARVTAAMVRRFEEYDGQAPSAAPNLAGIKTVLQDAGIEFMAFARGRPGVRLR